MWKRKYPYQEEAGGDGSPAGVTGAHPAAGTGDDDTGGAGAGDQSGAGGLTAKAAAEAGGEAAGDEGEGDAGGRPDWCPEQFWKAGEGEEPGQVNTEALTKSWKDTRAELKAAKENVGGEAPEKPEDYAFTPPTETEVNYGDLAEDDPGMAAIRIAAKEAGLNQKQYQTLVETFFENCTDAIPPVFDEAAEKALVGKNADAVIAANVRWAQDLLDRGVISQDEYDEATLMGATGYGVRFIAKIRQEATGEKAIPLTAVDVGGALPSKAELHAMVGDPKYGNDPKYTADVDAKFAAVYGDAPAGTSEPNMGISHVSTAPANIRRADELRKQQAG